MSDRALGRLLMRAVAVILILLLGYYLGFRDGNADGVDLGIRIGELRCDPGQGDLT